MNARVVSEYLILIGIIVVLAVFSDLSEAFEKISTPGNILQPQIVVAVLIIFAAKVFIDISKPLIRKALETAESFRRTESAEVNIQTTTKLYSYVIWTLAVLLAILVIGPNLSGLLMSATIIGAVLIFALQTPISCLVGWFVIVTRTPYRIYDRIEIGDRVRGDVIDISIMHTKIREFMGDDMTGNIVSVPNSIILAEFVTNYTLDVPYVWDEVKVSITYESDLKLAEEIVRESTSEVVGDVMKHAVVAVKPFLRRTPMNRYLYDEPQILVDLKDSCVEVAARYLYRARGRRTARTEIYEKILERINEEERVEIAYPHMQIVYKK